MVGLRNRFESEVHLGFLAIVCLLLLLNFVSNFIIYRARTNSEEALAADLRTAGLAISRAVQEKFPGTLTESEKNALLIRHNLQTLLLVPSLPPDQTLPAKRRWFASIARKLPAGQLPDLAEKLLGADVRELTRGEGDEYFFVYPLSDGPGRSLIILSVDRPDLAYLDDSRKLLTVLLPSSLVIVLLVYLLLSRKIFSPFRKIRQQAEKAGRPVAGGENEAEAVVREYGQVIERLRQKEVELLKLNASIQSKADSLEHFNEYLLSSSSSGIITIDQDGAIRSLNTAARRILQLEDRDYTGAAYSDVFARYTELVGLIRTGIDDGTYESYREQSLSPPNGDVMIAGVTISPIRDNRQVTVGLSVLIIDLTELSHLRSELEKSRRLVALGEMAGGLAHQIRNALGAVGGFGNLVRRRLVNCGQPVESIDALLEETRAAETLIGRFLNFARPLSLERTRTELNAFLQGIIESFAVREGCRHIELTLSCSPTLALDIDATLLRQALVNVIDNAIQSYPEGRGEVRITVSEDAEAVQIRIQDAGSGILADDLEKIFTPFFSLRPSGTGLGLPLASKIVDLHGGRMEVESEVGQGTVFVVVLPVSQKSPVGNRLPEPSETT